MPDRPWRQQILKSAALDREARDHGIRHVGLPSRLATFALLPSPADGTAKDAAKSARGGKGGEPKLNWWQGDAGAAKTVPRHVT